MAQMVADRARTDRGSPGAIVDCVVAADELPNGPHIELDLAARYAVAEAKEAVIDDHRTIMRRLAERGTVEENFR